MTDIVAPPTITALPPAPLPTDTQTEFDAKAYASVAAQGTMVTQTNAATANVYTNSLATHERSESAAASALSAATSAAAAAISAGVTGWVSGSYAQYARVIDPGNFQIYIRRTAGSGSTPPRLDPANWAPILPILPVQPVTTADTIEANRIVPMMNVAAHTLTTNHVEGDRIVLINRTGLLGITIAGGGSDQIQGLTGPQPYNSRNRRLELTWVTNAYGGWI